MVANILVANITSNKYIVLSQKICAIHKNKHNYNKIRIQIILRFKFLCKKNKIKIIKIYFCILNEHLEFGKRMERIWNAFATIKLLSNLILMHKINYLLFKQMSMSIFLDQLYK